LRLKGGVIYEGRVIHQNESEVTFELLDGGTMTLPTSLIDQIDESALPEAATETPTPAPEETVEVIPPTFTPLQEAVSQYKPSEQKKALGAGLSAEELANLGQGRPRFGETFDTVGIVEVKRPGVDWEEMPGETVLFQGDRLRTKNGRTKILSENSEVSNELRVKEESSLAIPQGEKSGTVELNKGRLWSRIKAKTRAEDVRFRIRTPNAVAGVRGTHFYVEMQPERSRVAVFEGEVEVRGRKTPSRAERLSRLKALHVARDETFSNILDVDPQELKEWKEWDEWAAQTKADLRPFTGGVPGARGVVEGMIDSVAAEGKLHSSLVHDANRTILRNRQMDRLDDIGAVVLEYVEDMGHFPPEDKGFTHLQYNIENAPNWNGPYFGEDFMLPPEDMWGKEIIYRQRTSPKTGKVYGELISSGPNKRAEDGRGDDVRTLIIPPQMDQESDSGSAPESENTPE
jgi:hypothetical protein